MLPEPRGNRGATGRACGDGLAIGVVAGGRCDGRPIEGAGDVAVEVRDEPVDGGADPDPEASAIGPDEGCDRGGVGDPGDGLRCAEIAIRVGDPRDRPGPDPAQGIEAEGRVVRGAAGVDRDEARRGVVGVARGADAVLDVGGQVAEGVMAEGLAALPALDEGDRLVGPIERRSVGRAGLGLRQPVARRSALPAGPGPICAADGPQ